MGIPSLLILLAIRWIPINQRSVAGFPTGQGGFEKNAGGSPRLGLSKKKLLYLHESYDVPGISFPAFLKAKS